MSLADRIKELFAANPEQPVNLEPPQPEVVEGDGHPADYDPRTDPTMIEVRKPQYRDFIEQNGDGDVLVRRLRAGYIVSYRKREPGEETLAFVTEADELESERTEQAETFNE